MAMTPPRGATSLAGAPGHVLRTIVRHRRVIAATTAIELRKRYAGSALGPLWLLLHPLLLLGMYLFVFLVVFKVRFPGYSDFGYVLYVFAGLVPYLGFSEAVGAGSLAIKTNVHLVKNVMLPIELVPVRTVATALATQMVALFLLALLAAGGGELSPRLAALPLVLVLQFLLILGVVFVVSALGVIVQDIAYFVNLALLLLIFLSPIGFTPAMLPDGWQGIVWINPLFYMMEAFRFALLGSYAADPRALAGFAVIAVAAFAAGSLLFVRVKNALIDYE
jgi:lipopolysaccharide transport system permease protein